MRMATRGDQPELGVLSHLHRIVDVVVEGHDRRDGPTISLRVMVSPWASPLLIPAGDNNTVLPLDGEAGVPFLCGGVVCNCGHSDPGSGTSG